MSWLIKPLRNKWIWDSRSVEIEGWLGEDLNTKL